MKRLPAVFPARSRVPKERAGYATIAAKLKLREDAGWCSRRLIELLAEGPSGDMFWMYPVRAIAYNDRGQLSGLRRTEARRRQAVFNEP